MGIRCYASDGGCFSFVTALKPLPLLTLLLLHLSKKKMDKPATYKGLSRWSYT